MDRFSKVAGGAPHLPPGAENVAVALRLFPESLWVPRNALGLLHSLMLRNAHLPAPLLGVPDGARIKGKGQLIVLTMGLPHQDPRVAVLAGLVPGQVRGRNPALHQDERQETGRGDPGWLGAAGPSGAPTWPLPG